MIDFSTLKGLTIPEGNVTKITDASGRVLWNADDGMRTVMIAGSGHASYCYVMIDGVKYTSTATLEVPVGTIITCYVHDKYGANKQSLKVNGVELAKDAPSYKFTYDYTVTSTRKIMVALLAVANPSEAHGTITINEI